MIEISLFCLSAVILIVGIFWIHRKYPKAPEPTKLPFSLEDHMRWKLEVEERMKALWNNYTGDTLTPWSRGPNSL
jgi:hypothetical protein